MGGIIIHAYENRNLIEVPQTTMRDLGRGCPANRHFQEAPFECKARKTHREVPGQDDKGSEAMTERQSPYGQPYPGSPQVGRYDPESIYQMQEEEMVRWIGVTLNDWLNEESERRGYDNR